MSERSMFAEFNAGSADIQAVAFSANGEYLYCGSDDGIQVWQVEDGKKLATMQCGIVYCFAVSKDGKWIAAGTEWGRVFVWDAKTYQKAWEHNGSINGVDFSPDSTQLVVASYNAAAVWDIVSFQPAFRSLQHKKEVIAAKYSPRGDRIATATHESVRLYTSYHGHLLAEIKLKVTPQYNAGLLWFNSNLFVLSNNKIKQVDLSTKSVVCERTVPDTNRYSSISLSQQREFIACSAKRNITFWHASTHSPLGSIEYDQFTRPIALSPDDRFLAIGGLGGKITIKKLSRITAPDIRIGDAVVSSWKNGQLENSEELLSTAIEESQGSNCHLFASRALLRTRLQKWDDAIIDAEKSIGIQPSVFGYIAKSIALIGQEKRREACRACDTAFEYCSSSHVSVSFLLLLKAIIVFMTGEHDDAISRVGDLISTVGFDATCHEVRAYMHFLLGNSRMDSGDYEGAVKSFEQARARIRCRTGPSLVMFSMAFGWKFDDPNVVIQQRLCEALFAAGRKKEAEDSFLKIVQPIDTEARGGVPLTEWVSSFAQRCLSIPSNGDVITGMPQGDEVPTSAPVDLMITPTPLLREWAKSTLASVPWRDALSVATNFVVPRFVAYRAICEHLETIQRILEAGKCLRQMVDELTGQTSMSDEQAKWIIEKLESFGDIAMRTERHDDAILQYSIALSFDPRSPPELLVKRSKAYLAKGLWKDAFNDAEKVISLDEASPWGYERKHAALHKAGDYDNAIDTFKVMRLKMSKSADANIRNYLQQYVDPGATREVIRKTVQDVIRDSPRVLINTISGRLCDKTKQAAAFESLPVFKELISSMTTLLDLERIKQSVTKYYRYAMFSHRWEDNEPLFDKIMQTLVHHLEKTPTHDKLQMYCKIVREAGFSWAWSDTCCIDKSNNVVLQEALVSMFRWYEEAALTIVYLLGVHSPSQPGDLVNSIWNTRAWTFQEYHASKVVRFYTQDWKPYLNLDISNHKESPEIILEMEKATHVSAHTLMGIRPGLDNIREKLCLASRRETTLIEDAAYSLFGIFSVSLPVVYGEGDKALGRLLAQLLMNSGETSILAWTGKSGGFNSCLPTSIVVFEKLPTKHIPAAIKGAEMEVIIAGLPGPFRNLTLVMKLYDRLHDLSLPSFAGQRMKLPCLTFRLGPIAAAQRSLGRVFRAKATGLGVVLIKTTEDLSRFDSLILVHPWIDFLLDRQRIGSHTDALSDQKSISQSSTTSGTTYSIEAASSSSSNAQNAVPRFFPRFGRQLAGRPQDLASLKSPTPLQLPERQMEALRVIARLRQPFGALLFARTRQNVEEYRRVAADSMIMVQIQEDGSLNELIDGARMLNVL